MILTLKLDLNYLVKIWNWICDRKMKQFIYCINYVWSQIIYCIWVRVFSMYFVSPLLQSINIDFIWIQFKGDFYLIFDDNNPLSLFYIVCFMLFEFDRTDNRFCVFCDSRVLCWVRFNFLSSRFWSKLEGNILPSFWCSSFDSVVIRKSIGFL